MKTGVLAICLLLAGCSGKVPGIRVRIATVGPGLQTFSLPITLAQTLGYYKEAGLDISLEALPSMGKSLQALLGGSVDVACVSYAQLLEVATEGQRLRSFFVMTRRAGNTQVSALRSLILR